MPIDYSAFAFPKPSDKRGAEPKKAVKKEKPTREFKDKTTGEKRLVLSKADWAKFRKKYWRDHPNVLCTACGKKIKWEDFELDHKDPRGMGGARRQDAFTNLQPMHHKCNTKKGSKRG